MNEVREVKQKVWDGLKTEGEQAASVRNEAHAQREEPGGRACQGNNSAWGLERGYNQNAGMSWKCYLVGLVDGAEVLLPQVKMNS